MKLFFFLLLSLYANADSGMFPNAKFTPGAVDPQATKELVCQVKPSYTQTHRKVNEGEKKAVFYQYGIDPKDSAKYEVDHFIPLCLGGTNDQKNLWPQPLAMAKLKDKVEDELHRRVCTGKISLDSAHDVIRTNWHDFYLKMKKGK